MIMWQMGAVTDISASTQVSGGQESILGEDVVCVVIKGDLSYASRHPINDFMLDDAKQEDDQFSKWKTVVRKKRWCHKSGNSTDAKFKRVEIFVSRLKPDTRIVCLKNGFGTSSRMQEMCSFYIENQM